MKKLPHESTDKSKEWPGLVVAVSGSGLHPRDLPARELIEMLQATLSTLEAIASEKGLKIPKEGFRVTELTTGSVAARVACPDPGAIPVVASFVEAARTRGKNNGPKVRNSLHRLQQASKIGGIRLVYSNTEPVDVAAPLQESLPGWEETEEVYGEIVGLHKVRGQVRLTLRHEGGGTTDFIAQDDAARVAVRLFGKQVRGVATFSANDDEDAKGLEILRLESWGGDVTGVEFFDEIRRELAAQDVVIDPVDWLLTEDD